MAFGGRPGTDYGTAALHAILLASFLVLLATGLRIASDDPDAMWLAVLDPLLPMEDLWYWHLVSGVVLVSALAAHAVFVRRTGLSARIHFDSARLLAMWRGGRPRLVAMNVTVVWVLLGALAVEIVSGAMLFWDGGERMLSLHLWATWFCIGCVALHVGLHGAYGGLEQLLRVFRPRRLRVSSTPDLADLVADQLRNSQDSNSRSAKPSAATDANAGSGMVQSHPVAGALLVGAVVIGLAWSSETLTRPVLPVHGITAAEAPTIDGDLSDPVWARATMASVMTTQGGDFGGGHQSRVEIRALHDDEFAYFAFVWEDPTRSLKHHPLVKDRTGWHVAGSRDDLEDENIYNEDKFAVLLSSGGLPLIGAAIHLSLVPLAGRPNSSSGRGLHYTLDGTVLDVWQWRASHGGQSGQIDNCHIGGPVETDGSGLFSGGFGIDGGRTGYQPNFVIGAGSDAEASQRPRRLPKDLAAMREALGRLTDATNESESETARWWMTESESIPYAESADAAIPPGTVIPGVIVDEKREARPDDLRGFGRWAAGRWTLELVRRLRTGDAYDVDIKDGVLMWVAAFDHSEKRHTRHLRPFRLQLE